MSSPNAPTPLASSSSTPALQSFPEDSPADASRPIGLRTKASAEATLSESSSHTGSLSLKRRVKKKKKKQTSADSTNTSSSTSSTRKRKSHTRIASSNTNSPSLVIEPPQTRAHELFTQDYNVDSPQGLHDRLHSLVMSLEGSKSPAAKLFLTHYLAKAANWSPEHALNLERPIPRFAQTTLVYHRDYVPENELLKQLSERISELTGLDKNEILPVYHPAVFDSLSLFFPIQHLTSSRAIASMVSGVIEEIRQQTTAESVHLLVLKEKYAKHKKQCEYIQKCAKIVRKNLQKTSKDEQVNISQRIMLISLIEVDGQPVLLFPLLSKEKYLQTNKVEFLRKRVALGGHTPTMLQARHTLHSSISLPTTPPFESNDTNYHSVEDFLKCSYTKGYLESELDDERRLLHQMNCHLVLGLQSKGIVDNALKGWSQLANSALNRLSALMYLSCQKTSYVNYCLLHELMAEEYLLLLSLTNPYVSGDFEAIYLQNRRSALGDMVTSLTSPISEPIVATFSSGMGCVDAILRLVCKDHPGILVASTEDNYFETTDQLATLPSFMRLNIPRSPKEIPLLKLSPDIAFVDIRPPTDTRASEYAARDLIATTHLLLQEREGRPLTLVIDATYDELHSEEIERFIHKQQDLIASQALHIGVFRSAQKFDQGGSDKFNGGYLEFHTCNETLKSQLKELPGQLSGLDYHALCFYHDFAHHDIRMYVQKHYQNTHLAYEHLSALQREDSFLKMTPKTDEKLSFIELTYPTISSNHAIFRDLLVSLLCNRCQQQKLGVVYRDSFGFNESTLCAVDSYKIRFSPGTHSEQEMKHICEILLSCEGFLVNALKEIEEEVTQKHRDQHLIESLRKLTS